MQTLTPPSRATRDHSTALAALPPAGCLLDRPDPIEVHVQRGLRSLSRQLSNGIPLREVLGQLRALYAETQLARIRRDIELDQRASALPLARLERPLSDLITRIPSPQEQEAQARRALYVGSGRELW